MRRRTRMPVVLQPADSGFNSHLRRSSSGESSGRIGDALTGAPGSGTPVPFLRVLYEREVATMSMPHLKSLDIELQARSDAFLRFFAARRVIRCALNGAVVHVARKTLSVRSGLYTGIR